MFKQDSTNWILKMTRHGELPSVKTLEAALTAAKSPVSVFTVHGMMTGLFCGGLPFDQKSWKEPLMQCINDGRLLNNEGMDTLERMYLQLANQLQERVAFAIPLPEFEKSLQPKLEALGAWCDGWVTGFGLALPQGSKLSKDVEETVYEITEISHMDTNIEHNEESEEAYQAILEHITQAVEYIFDLYGAGEYDNGSQN